MYVSGQGKGKTMATYLFTTIDDVVEYYVIPTLGDYAGDYDVRGIAEAISHYGQEGFRIIESIQSDDNPQAYWDIVASHARGN